MPIIAVKRDSITKNRSIANKLDANMPSLYTSWQKTYSDKNFYSNFNVLNNRVQTKQFIANVVPDYVNLQYSVIIQTYYMDPNFPLTTSTGKSESHFKHEFGIIRVLR